MAKGAKDEKDIKFLANILKNSDIMESLFRKQMLEDEKDYVVIPHPMPSYKGTNSKGTMIKIVNIGDERIDKSAFDGVMRRIALLHQIMTSGDFKKLKEEFPECVELTEFRTPHIFLSRFAVKGFDKLSEIRKLFNMLGFNTKYIKLSKVQQDRYNSKSNILVMRFKDNKQFWSEEL